MRSFKRINLAPILEHVELGRGDMDRGGGWGEKGQFTVSNFSTFRQREKLTVVWFERHDESSVRRRDDVGEESEGGGGGGGGAGEVRWKDDWRMRFINPTFGPSRDCARTDLFF